MWSNDMQPQPIRDPKCSPGVALVIALVALVMGLLLVIIVACTRPPTVLRTTQLENGMWFVYWSTERSVDSTVNVQCAHCTHRHGDTSLQLVSNVGGDMATLSVKVNKGTTELPLKIHASHNGQVKQVVVTERGASVSFHQTKYVHATYQLIIEFEDTRFAKGERHVLAHLSNLLDTQSMADVTFVVKKEKIGAHSAIVLSGSPVICAMLENGNFKEGRTKVVQVEDIEPPIFKEMLRYLYTGKAPKVDEDEMTEPLFLAADKYKIGTLKDLCEQSLISKLNVQDVAYYLVLAHLQSAPQLLEASLKFLEEHKKEIVDRAEWKQLNKNHPDLFFLATHRMMGLLKE